MSMPRTKPSALTGTAELNAMIEWVAPAILGLLADGVPRTKAAIVAALAGRHARDDVAHTLIRLVVTGRVVETGGKYTLAAGPGPTSGPPAPAAVSRARRRSRGRRPPGTPSWSCSARCPACRG